MKKGRPTYPLTAVKAAFADAARINRTMTALIGAEDLGIDEYMIVDIIRNLSAKDFDKTMPSEVNPAIWQDVYKPIVDGQELYVKFTLDSRGQLLLISFKDNTP